jgi:putative hydrolase
MRGFPYDAHIHTDATGGRDSLVEVVRAAEAQGLELAVIATAETPANETADGEDLRDRVREIVRADVLSPVLIVPAIETQIADAQGKISLNGSLGRLAPVVYTALGGRTDGIALNPPASKQRYLSNIFQALLAAVQNPLVTALARPFNIGQFPAPLSPSQMPRSALTELAAAMDEYDVAFELSNQMHWWFPELSVEEFIGEYAALVSVFSRRNVKFVVSSDAMSAGAVGNQGFVLRLMEEAGVERSQVIDLLRMIKSGRAG